MACKAVNPGSSPGVASRVTKPKTCYQQAKHNAARLAHQDIESAWIRPDPLLGPLSAH